MRAYSLAVAAASLEVDRKWLDNVLTQHDVLGVYRERQGVSRMISPQAILTIAIAILLARHLGSPIARALTLAHRLLDDGEQALDADVVLRVDVGGIERRLATRLADAVESHPPARRGRPPRQTSLARDAR